MKVLLTGAAGFIGSNIAKYLQQKSVDLLALDDFSHSDYRNILDLNLDVVWADICDKSTYSKLPKVDAVIHEAAITDTTLADDKRMVKVNYGGFKNLFDFCCQEKIPFIYASSAGVYGRIGKKMSEQEKLVPHNTYAYSKYLCDSLAVKYMKNKKLPPIIALRYFNVYGPGEVHKGKSASMVYQLYKQMAAGRNPLLFKLGEQKRDFIYVKDVARITAECLNLNKSAISNVGTGYSRSFNDIVAILNKRLGKKLEPKYIDNPYQDVYQDYTEAETKILREVLKNKAEYSLEEGINDYLKNYLMIKEPKK